MTKAYPLLRTRWSNEHIMAGLFAVLLLYLLPVWIGNPGDILSFFAVLAFSLLLDAVCGFIRFKRPVCSVSAAVTAGILQILTPGIPLWGRLAAVFTAIIIGKQLWGGTGKNTMNPAVLGYLVICILFETNPIPIAASGWLIPALVLSIPFIIFRPFTALGYLAGIIAAMLTGAITVLMPLAATCIFIGCIVLTDPVTVTPLRSVGLAGGFVAAFLPFNTINPAVTLALTVLIFNLVSYLAGEYLGKPRVKPGFSGIVMNSPYSEVDYSSSAVDLTDNGKTYDSKVCAVKEPVADSAGNASNSGASVALDPDQILERIKRNEVYGMGGGAFPTSDKIGDVISSGADKKYLIINAVECDPGLIHDKWLLKNRYDDIFKGIELISKCIGFDGKYIAIKEKTQIRCSDNISVFRVKNYYPSGYEKALIRSVLGIDVPEGSVPSKLGILVLNVQTLIAVYEAVNLNRKADGRYITVSDLKNGVAKVAKVKLGANVFETVQNVFPGSHPVFSGGGIMQSHMADDEELVEKKTNFITVSSLPRYKESPFCSNCGSCRANCPMGLVVSRIADLAEQGRFEESRKYHPEKCIKCGLCSYVCLAGKNLSAKVSEAREKVLL